MDKYEIGTYKAGYFIRRSNINLKLITSRGKIIIPLILRIYVLHWYHMYLLHPGMYRMEEILHQHFYWPDIRNTVRK